MLARIIRGSLRHPRLIAAACVIFLAYGALLIPTEAIDLLPNLTPARASIETEAPGMVAEQVEQLVTRPIENALIGAHGVAAVHSQSIQGLSIVTLEFQPGADPYRVRQAISESLVSSAGALPGGVQPPRLSPLVATGGEVLKIGFTSDRLTPMALREVVQWTVRPRLLSVPGVASVQVFGGEVRRIEVRARSGDLSDSDLGYGDVFEAVRRATGVTGAGFIDTPSQRVLIEPHGQALTPDDIAAGQIQIVGSAPTRISDVADVVEAATPAIGDAQIMGKPGVILSIDAQYGANPLATTNAIQAAVAPLATGLAGQGVRVDLQLDRPAAFIDHAVGQVARDVVIGAVLIAILLILFLRDWRAALVSFIAIPLSITASLIAIKLLGWTINTMTLGGLAVALGLIVDDSLIDVESIVRRMRQAESQHASRTVAVLKAALEVRAPVLYATALIVIGLAPVLFLTGEQGALVRPLAAAIIAAMIASLVIAIAVTPALALLFLGHIRPAADPGWIQRLRTRYALLLDRVGKAFGWVFAALCVLGLAAIVMFVTFRGEFLPDFHGGHLTATISAPASTSMAVMGDYGGRITHDLLSNPNITRVSEQVGRAETSGMGGGPEQARFDIELKPRLNIAAQNRVEAEVRRAFLAYPGLNPEVGASLGPAAHGAGRERAVQVRIFGDDLDALDLAASRVTIALAAVPGARNVTRAATGFAPAIRIDLNFQRLAIYGLSAADVLETVQTAFEGRDAARIYEKGRAIDVAVTAQDTLRRDPEGVGDLLLRSSSGLSTPLKNVANVYLTDGRTSIEHDSGLRRQVVYVDPPRDVAHFVKLAQDRIARDVTLPSGTYVEVIPPDQGAIARARLLPDGALAAAAIITLLLVAFGSARACVFILGVTGFAFIGGVAAVALMGGVLSLGAVAGFVTLFGLSTRNAMILIARLDDLVTEGKLAWCEATVRVAATDRLAPILFSALLIAAGLAPLAFQAGDPGQEVLGPMVWVILAGLLTSTAMSLILSPALAYRLWRPKPIVDAPSARSGGAA